MVGGNRNDVLRGGIGRDTLFGGVGRDSFVLKAEEGNDLIVDYNLQSDRSILSEGLNFEDLKIVRNIDNTQGLFFSK